MTSMMRLISCHEASMKADEGIADMRRPLFLVYLKGGFAWV